MVPAGLCFTSKMTEEESQFDPQYPFDHLLWMSVNAEIANKWWEENFVWQADKIINGVKPMREFLDGDAPIAADRERHVITAFQQTVAVS